ncbi:MAG: alanine--tRNA ligase [Clostridiaceae bacterium]
MEHKKMTMNELRKSYLNFFEERGHLVLDSFSLVPKEDKSLILINSGMAPLKPYFTGAKVPPRNRVTTCQKCIRTLDIDNVGKTSRHATFFEMLGNFSFGDYFKKEIIPWAWEYMTEVLKLPKDRLYATIYEEDDEAFEIWATMTDIGEDRIFRLGKADNFWEIGVGPCGPCSEIHYDYGNAGKLTTRAEFEAASEADKTVEVWNLVFTQFDRDEDGNYNLLAKPNIDTGMGLERLATIMQGVTSIFETDAIRQILAKAEELLGVTYGDAKSSDTSLRIITDHVKSAAMLISDGVLPSNEGRGYILRRLLRRAARHGRVLNQKEAFLSGMLDAVAENYGEAYPSLIEKLDYIKKIVLLEEEKFNQTIDQGTNVLMQYIGETQGEIFSGDHAFKLYDTFGFPLELTEEIVGEKGLKIDYDRFNANMKNQKEMARAARGESNFMGQDVSVINTLKTDIPYEFTGYDEVSSTGKLLLLSSEDGEAETLEQGQSGYVVLDRSPFYAEMGGQVGDLGEIVGENFVLKVLDTKKNASGATVNIVEVIDGTVVPGPVVSTIAVPYRDAIRKNHTATHLLHKALKLVLGTHVNQSGSLVDGQKLRFDFNHYSALTKDELLKVEDLVNAMIMKASPVQTDIMTIDQAKESGAMALFDAKYGEAVRVLSVGEDSKELCGGTHVANSGQIGLFKITSEAGVASGVRRIEALTGLNAIEFVRQEEKVLQETGEILKTNPHDLVRRTRQVMTELKDKDREINEAKKSQASDNLSELMNNVKEVNGIKVVSGVVEGMTQEDLRNLAEKALDKIVSGVSVMASRLPDRVAFVIMVSKDLAGKTAHAGKLIGEIAKVADGKGGGRPDMAQAGGTSPHKAQEAVNKIFELL